MRNNPSTKFENAFQRYLSDVKPQNIRSFNQLHSSIQKWGGSQWIDSNKQISALRYQAIEHNIGINEIVSVKRGFRIRDVFSGRFISNKTLDDYRR